MGIWIALFVLVLMTGGTKSQDQIVYLDDEGTAMNMTSPNYPSNYDNNVDIWWKVVAPIGFRIRLQFNDFNLEALRWNLGWYGDSLTVYLGLTDSLSDATLRATLSGSSLPGDISSTGSYMWLYFTSDGSDTRQGFSASVSTIEPEFISLTSEETINSPNYPGNYPNSVGMWWKVIAPTGIRISLQFSDFQIWNGDFLTVYLGLIDSLSDATLRATLSGSSLPGDISSTGSYMWLHFTSDERETQQGFSLLVSTIKSDKHEVINLTSEESMVNINSPNYPDDYDNNVGVLWQVIAPIGSRIKVQFSVFDLDSGSDSREGDSLILRHGLTNSLDNATLRDLLSGSSLPLEISSLGSYLWIWFTSDYTVTRRGFSLSVGTVQPGLHSTVSMTTALSPSTMPVGPLIDPSIGEPVNMETTMFPSIMQGDESADISTKGAVNMENTMFPSTMQEDGSADISTKGAGLYVGVGCGVAIIFILVVVLVTATVFRRKRLQHSKAETEREDKPYMDLMTRDTRASVYETIGTSTIPKIEEISYENQKVVTQHRVMNQVTQEDDHTYEMAK